MSFLERRGLRGTRLARVFVFIPIVVVISLLLLKSAQAATISHVQTNQKQVTSGTTDAITFTNTTTAGNLIAVYVAWGNTGTVTVTDSNDNTYTAAAAATKWNSSAWSSEVFYAKNIIGGSDTITATFGTAITNFGTATIDEYSGLSTTSPLDVTTSAIGTAATMSSGSATTTNANDMIYGAGAASANLTATAGSGFTLRSSFTNSIIALTEDKSVTATGSNSATATQNTSFWVMHMVAFKAASTTPPTVPTGLTATPVSTSQINLSWTASTDSQGVAGYKIYRNGTQVGTSTTTTYSDTGLTASTSYSYTVSAYDTAGNVSAQSSTVSATTQSTPDTTPPTAPTNLAASQTTQTQVNLSWTASTDNVGVTGYTVYRSTTAGFTPSAANKIGATTTATTYSDTTVNIGTYYYLVTASDAAGNVSTPSNQATILVTDVTPPSAPTAFVATDVSQTQVNLSWTASTDNVGVTGYNVYRSTTTGFTPSTGNFIGTSSTTTYSDTSVNAGKYYYLVTAFDAAGNVSTASAQTSITVVDTTPPSIPTGLTATPISGLQVNLSWTASTDNVGVTGYNVYRNGTLVGTTVTPTYSDTGLSASTTYTYSVSAYDAAGNVSAQSAGIQTTTLAASTIPPTAPTNVTVTDVSQTQAKLTWTASTDSSGVTGYTIYRSTTSGFTLSPATQVGTTTGATSYTDSTVNAGTYYYLITATDTYSNVSTASAQAKLTIADTTPPTMPTGLTATAISPTQVNITWNASTDNVSVSGYILYRNGAILSFVGPATSYTDTTVVTNTTYTYSISAYDEVFNQSAITSTVSVKTPSNIVDTTPPSIPTGLTATAASSVQVSLSWTASTDNVGVTGYNVYRGGTKIATTTTPSYQDSGLTPSTNYSYTVAAYDAAGNVSAPSTAATVTTQPPDTTPPSVPTGLSATAISSSQITLVWTASTDNVAVAGYNIYRGGTLVGTTAGVTYSDTGLTASTAYSYTVAAYDAAGNVSAQSTSASATTFSLTQTTPGVWTSIAPPQVSTNFDLNPANNYGFNSIVIDPDNPDVLYLGTQYQGLWKSTNQGATWTKIDTGANSNLLDEGRLWTLAIDPFNDSILWTTSGYGAGGPLESTDGGVDWTLIPVGAPTQANDVYDISVDPYTPNHILMTWHSPWSTDNVNSGVTESTNGGVTWINHQPPAGSNWGAGNAIWFLNNSQTWLLGSQTNGIWRTTNSGTTWTEVRAASMTHGAVNALFKDPTSTKLYLTGGNNSGGMSTVDVSTDDGVTWTPTVGLPMDYYSTVVTDGTNLYTAPSFPVQTDENGPWYYMPLSGGTWQPYTSPNTCYTDPSGDSACNGPVMGAYDATNHIAYTVNYLGGVWKIQGPH